jgi:hypothetical protein
LASNFEASVAEFRQFLADNHYPSDVTWVQPEDVLLSGRRLIYVRAPVSAKREQEVRELFDLSQSSHNGIVFGTICFGKDTTYAYAWMPSDALEAQRALTASDTVKMSAKTGISKVPGAPISSVVLWTYLKLRLNRKQFQKAQLFR